LRQEAAAVLVFAAAFVLLGWWSQPLGYGYLDPVARIEPQDECVYAHAALRMAERGEWATPYFLGRFFLYKPPLLYWATGAAVKLLGRSEFALRLPSRLAGAAVCLLVFLWTQRWAAALLVAATPLFGQLANRTMTDALLCLFLVLALWLVHRGAPWWAVGAVGGLAILTKSTAGLVPLGIYFGYTALAKPRPPWWQPFAASILASLVAAPWFLYQWLVHPRWFWAEFVEVELLAYGAGAPPQQTAGETFWGFYAVRIAAVALAVTAGAAAAAWKWWQPLSRRQPEAVLLALWVVLMGAAIASYQYRNIPYLLPLVPPLAIIASRWAPSVFAAIAVAIACLTPASQPVERLPVRQALERRAAMARPNDVLVVNLTEQFYATTLPLPRVRYALPAAEQPPAGFTLDFRRLGITVSVGDFLRGNHHARRAELLAWGLPDDSALASVIEYRSPEEVEQLVAAQPTWDVVFPDGRLRLGSAMIPR
jgi:4-amino-4-deoxy-L-arabinose transferase-like glycosyltransferase